jgi:uncharacterized damage-inducible protein DinB
MTTITPLQETFRFNTLMLTLLTRDLSDQDARRSPRENGGASVVWILNHLYGIRLVALDYLSAASHHTPLPPGQSLGAMRTAWQSLQHELDNALSTTNGETLSKKLKRPKAPPHVKTLLDALVFYAWHEAYHLGAIAAFRASLDYPSTSTVIMNHMKK